MKVGGGVCMCVCACGECVYVWGVCMVGAFEANINI